jgi:hypothetical protein
MKMPFDPEAFPVEQLRFDVFPHGPRLAAQRVPRKIEIGLTVFLQGNMEAVAIAL